MKQSVYFRLEVWEAFIDQRISTASLRHHSVLLHPPSEAKVDNYAARMTINQVRNSVQKLWGQQKCCQRH